MSEEATQDVELETPEKVLEKRLDEIREQLGEVLDPEDIGTTIVIFTHKDSDEPQVWRKGHFYDAATLLSEVLRMYKMKAAQDLGF